MKKSCAIVGAGIAGMATAIRLRKLGYEVQVFESRSRAGGKIDQLDMDGFRFDTGPTVLTMPELIDDLFRLHQFRSSDYFSYRRLDHAVRYFFPEGLEVDAYADLEKYAAEVQSKLGVDRGRFFRYVRDAEMKFKLTQEVFLRSSLHRVSNYLRWIALKGVLLFPKVGAFRTMSRHNHGIFRNEQMEKIANRYAQYNGSDPYRMPSTFNVIGHVEISKGIYVAEGGMRGVSEAVFRLAEMVGVTFHFNTPVTRIVTENHCAKGIMVNGQFLPFDVIVSNSDIVFTHEHLLSSPLRANELKKREKSSSSVIFYWGVKKSFDRLGAHNFFFGKDCSEEFKRVFSGKTAGDDFTIYLHISSKYQSADAPEGCENWFVMVNTPNDIGQNWEAESQRLRRLVLKRLSAVLGTDLETVIRCERCETPRGIAEKYHCFRGAIYGDSSNNMYAAFLRHPNFSGKYAHLYFAGGSVHPGAGIPLCLYSAEITADLIAEREQV